LELLKDTGSEGVTISGGEPFYQPEGLHDLALALRAGGVRDILAYSGKRIEDILREHPWAEELFTAVVDGPFEEDRPTDAPWKGSDGQALHVLDPSFADIYREWSLERERVLQVVPMEGGFRVLGIPRIGDLV
jgi:anaerobic ribonucleoside-triphosphate reductase activating protein